MAKILLVDDYKLTRELYKALLEERGYEVEVAKNGDEAENKVNADNYGLIVVDMVIPGVSSVDLVRGVEKKKGGLGRVAVMYTVGQESLVEEMRNLGVKKLILKSTTDHHKVVDEIENAVVPRSGV
jgi:DNA-binding response OmpR family regulator